ncbi:hypothetical protein SCLCIDRAFT_1140603 [Scleroderma citrinum Foug A]|uniref:Uncharacterized protein n=1 Tax=Scleroderma citrinum Foug A TaxID=1036808 RepID=A0A0C2Z5R5_9AGAM|nr:hypothetical protein SCLCIDRAFT_1140603 [Scleroderma citrinum Foug A]
MINELGFRRISPLLSKSFQNQCIGSVPIPPCHSPVILSADGLRFGTKPAFLLSATRIVFFLTTMTRRFSSLLHFLRSWGSGGIDVPW